MMRTDLQVRNEGCRRFRNAMNMAGGGFRRRWGTVDLAALTGISRLETYGIGEDDAQILVFGAGRFEVRELDGTLVQAITTGCPWTTGDLKTMQVAIEDGRIVVASRSFFPRLLTLGATWSIAPLAFAPGLNGSLRQPYFRYLPPGVSLAPSAYTGSVTVTASAPMFVTTHVGTRIRYTGIEILITAFTSSTVVTGTVQGNLYPTLDVTVGSSAGFIVGQVVQGKDTQIEGVVAAVTSGTALKIQLIGGYTTFDLAEKLTGPTAETTMSAITTSATPAATTDWDEALIGDSKGYPGAVSLHRNRLMLGSFPLAQSVIAASATGDITDFSVGTGLETDAIVERVSRDSSLGLRHFGSTEQLLMFTEAGVYYIPEQVGAPLSPTNYEVLKIGPEAASTPQPLLVSEGMGFIEQNSGRMMIALPTGNVRRSWEISDTSELAFHLMLDPVEMELMVARTESDRLVPVLLADGDAAVLTFRRGAQFSAWALWQTTGAWRSIVVAAGRMFAVSARTINGVLRYRLERFDEGAWCDGRVSLPTLATPVTQYANSTVGVWDGASKVGEYAVNGSGVLVGVDDTYTAVQVGLDFVVEVETVPPVDGERGLRPNYKITRVDVDVIGGVGFKGNGRDPSGWSGAIGGATIPQTGVRRFRPLGRAKYPTFTIRQEIGGPLEIRSLTMEVTS